MTTTEGTGLERVGRDGERVDGGGGDGSRPVPPLAELERRAADLRRDLLERFERLCRDGHEAEDVVQEALLRAFRSLASRTGPIELRPWLMQVTRRVLYDRGRREGRRRYLESSTEVDEVLGREPEPWERVEDPEAGTREADVRLAERAVRDGLASLRVADRELLIDHYERGLSCPELAARDGARPQTVKVRLYRARRRLARQLERRLVLDGGRD